MIRIEIISREKLEAMLLKSGWTVEVLDCIVDAIDQDVPPPCPTCGARWSCAHEGNA